MLQGNKEGIKKLPNNLERSVTIGMETEIFTKVFKFDQKINFFTIFRQWAPDFIIRYVGMVST